MLQRRSHEVDDGTVPTQKPKSSASGRFYRKFEHRVEKRERTNRRVRRNMRLLLKHRPEKAEELS